jgi:hypothetical protein
VYASSENCLVVTVWIGAPENTGTDMNFDDLEHCMMVDTLGLRVHNVDPSRLPKKFIQMGSGDAHRWAKGNLQTAAGKNSLKVTAVKSRKAFCIEGSPAFHRQGHNIVSSGDVSMLAFAAAQDCNRELSLGISLERAKQFASGTGMEVTRIDTPVLLRKPEGLAMAAVINGLALAGVLAGHNTSVYVNQTVYFDQHSQLTSLKGYDKLAEIQGKRRLEIPTTSNTDDLIVLAGNTIRMEAVFRQKWLQRKFGPELLTPARLTPDVLAAMFGGLLEDYDLRRDIRKPLSQEALMEIPRRFRPYVLLWQNANDMSRVKAENPVEYSRAKNYLELRHSVSLDSTPPQLIEQRVELGDILSAKNFMAVPAAIAADPTLFFRCDMAQVRQQLDGDQLGP